MNENNGQSVFEKELIAALLAMGEIAPHTDLRVYLAGSLAGVCADKRVEAIPLDKSSYWGFVRHQFALLARVGAYLWRQRGQPSALYFRYHPSMFAPLLLSIVFNCRMTLRTGPILPNLARYHKDPNWLAYQAIRILCGAFYRRASSIITVTEKIKAWVVQTYAIDPQKVVVVPNAVNTTMFQPGGRRERERWGLPAGQPVFGFVGQIHEDQGLDTVLGALGILKERRATMPWLLVVGDGPELPRLQKKAEALGVASHIAWTGRVPHASVPSAINVCDVMLAPFKKRAFQLAGSSSLKVLEYLACDRPVLASQAPDHAFIEDLDLGQTVAPEDEPAWADAIVRLASNPMHLHGRGALYVGRGRSYGALARRVAAIALGLDAPSPTAT